MDQMLEAYAAAVRAKDVDAFVGLYADDVRNFDLWNEWSYDGKDALRGMVSEWFGSLGDDEEVVVEFDDVRTTNGGDVVTVSAFTTYAAVSPDGRCTVRSTAIPRGSSPSQVQSRSTVH